MDVPCTVGGGPRAGMAEGHRVNHWIWLFGKITRRLWFRSSLYCLGGITAALAAIVLGPYIPPALTTKLGADAVGSILTIIASSMLAVTTFSLSTLVSATASAAGSATPRATTLMLEDETAQRALPPSSAPSSSRWSASSRCTPAPMAMAGGWCCLRQHF